MQHIRMIKRQYHLQSAEACPYYISLVQLRRSESRSQLEYVYSQHKLPALVSVGFRASRGAFLFLPQPALSGDSYHYRCGRYRQRKSIDGLKAAATFPRCDAYLTKAATCIGTTVYFRRSGMISVTQPSGRRWTSLTQNWVSADHTARYRAG